ncbi:hypothetical protein LUZ62_070732 [Rhynchospora pubera]|uniref:Transposase MuDR plant domain-containing protein n=1 Tax=Rhynchospora pubera TaxID=906938 RepID=A0AAV8CWZ9_9POAL|nr:hypothetical protein LUZ62_070732 [Rhynchospora pubera]
MRYRLQPKEEPNYGSGECLFTCEVHHGGTVHIDHASFSYTGCKKDHFDYIDPDEISLLEFETMAEQLGYSKEISVWCRVCADDNNPKLMISDQELMLMINKIPKNNRLLEYFFNHKEVQVEGVLAEKEVQEAVEDGDKELNGLDADKDVEVDCVDADKDVEVDGVDDDNADGSDFYDPNNDVEVDDIDVNSNKNGIDENLRRDWVIQYKTQSQLVPTEDGSDYAPSDVLLSGGETDGEETSRRYPEFNAEIDMKNPQFEVGMIFSSFEEFKTAIREYAIKQRRNVQFEKNDTMRVKAVC